MEAALATETHVVIVIPAGVSNYREDSNYQQSAGLIETCRGSVTGVTQTIDDDAKTITFGPAPANNHWPNICSKPLSSALIQKWYPGYTVLKQMATPAAAPVTLQSLFDQVKGLTTDVQGLTQSTETAVNQSTAAATSAKAAADSAASSKDSGTGLSGTTILVIAAIIAALFFFKKL